MCLSAFKPDIDPIVDFLSGDGAGLTLFQSKKVATYLVTKKQKTLKNLLAASVSSPDDLRDVLTESGIDDSDDLELVMNELTKMSASKTSKVKPNKPSSGPHTEFFVGSTPVQVSAAVGSTGSSVPLTDRTLLFGWFTDPLHQREFKVAIKICRNNHHGEMESLHYEREMYSYLVSSGGSRELACCPHMYPSPEGSHYLVLEEFGKDISHLKPNNAIAFEVAKKSLEALKSLHQLNIVHGDIKPHNILFRSDDGVVDVRLCDFDCSKRVGESFLTRGTKYNIFSNPHFRIHSHLSIF